MILRENEGKPVSGSSIAAGIGISRVAVWKGVQSLVEAGYLVETTDMGYALPAETADDFIYPWEFGEQESMFCHFDRIGSTMDSARELACCRRTKAAKAVVLAERQSTGRGRNGRSWASRRGGLFCTVIDQTMASEPKMAIADYSLPIMVYQIAIARALGSICGKPAWLQWPNDIFIGRQKIAGVISELGGEGDSIHWLSVGLGVNVNNKVPSEKAVSCAQITGHPVSRREVLLKILDEVQRVKNQTRSGMAYAQGNRILSAEWNAIAGCIGSRAAVVDSRSDANERVLARGIYSGVDPAGRCIIKSESTKADMYFNPGPVSVVFLNEQ